MLDERAKSFRVGLIGCGRISDIYLKTLAKFHEIDVVACASLDIEESQAKAVKYGIPKACLPDEIFADAEIDCVLNLTVPAAHADVSLRALKAGKHVYSEKPFVTDFADGARILDVAASKGLLVGNAPDTFLGGRWQTVRSLIDEGVIGKPTGVFAHVGTHGTERHHPNPDFYYARGGGPLLDLGPYYLTAMVFCLGPISRVAGMSRRTFDRRMIENGPRNGQWMPVDVDTHSLSLLEFDSGAIGDMTMSFDVWDSEAPRFEIYGEDGTICIPDPDPVHGANVFQGDVLYRTRETARWTHQPRPVGRDAWQVANNRHGFNEDSRGLGLLDLALAVSEGREPRASGALAYHVFEVMAAIEKAPREGIYQSITSRCDRPEPLPLNFKKDLTETSHAC
ncbi:Gfo/Idh/MocA family protein [Labrenzia sp. PHM005]|uniref:Gfo/Idh/MocA family protein n=1 Tax=Labrenzia sp. PHM005 TaxID=2590016 RepID=UPI0011406757|nr:Gfo/Idh/MocA family oxidoreductase [Labrenzia sp. PHM005]QDG78482.1 Gfo/Idh/MocA family oxidoreductase [Labrenzia sp. PHM005]